MANIKSISLPLGLKIHLLENSVSKFSVTELFNENYFSIILVKSGSVNLQINENKIHLFTNEIITIPLSRFCKVLYINEPSEICVLSFTLEFAYINSLKHPHIGYFELYIAKYPAKIALKNKDFLHLLDLFRLLFSKAKRYRKHVFKEETLMLGFNLLIYDLAERYYQFYKELNIDNTLKEKILLQFFRTLELNYKKQHGVKFYADVLCITADHLTKIVKESTQKTAKEFIVDAIILESKYLLQNQDLTIINITEELQFGNSSLFSNFFKKHTFLSPSEYRLSLNIPNTMK
ncbi:helix-turn-helix domain-containing protein [Flavobacterium hydatis]|uniref:helix-turn-helix domain-containing protein n=1 Tax=Flavobacterium hydatis TaxID=991 RepID=UPI000ACBB806|nr:helix-turn-helix domain-containing protein [Flavobacterium hydatis]